MGAGPLRAKKGRQKGGDVDISLQHASTSPKIGKLLEEPTAGAQQSCARPPSPHAGTLRIAPLQERPMPPQQQPPLLQQHDPMDLPLREQRRQKTMELERRENQGEEHMESRFREQRQREHHMEMRFREQLQREQLGTQRPGAKKPQRWQRWRVLPLNPDADPPFSRQSSPACKSEGGCESVPRSLSGLPTNSSSSKSSPELRPVGASSVKARRQDDDRDDEEPTAPPLSTKSAHSTGLNLKKVMARLSSKDGSESSSGRSGTALSRSAATDHSNKLLAFPSTKTPDGNLKPSFQNALPIHPTLVGYGAPSTEDVVNEKAKPSPTQAPPADYERCPSKDSIESHSSAFSDISDRAMLMKSLSSSNLQHATNADVGLRAAATTDLKLESVQRRMPPHPEELADNQDRHALGGNLEPASSASQHMREDFAEGIDGDVDGNSEHSALMPPSSYSSKEASGGTLPTRLPSGSPDDRPVSAGSGSSSDSKELMPVESDLCSPASLISPTSGWSSEAARKRPARRLRTAMVELDESRPLDGPELEGLPGMPSAREAPEASEGAEEDKSPKSPNRIRGFWSSGETHLTQDSSQASNSSSIARRNSTGTVPLKRVSTAGSVSARRRSETVIAKFDKKDPWWRAELFSSGGSNSPSRRDRLLRLDDSPTTRARAGSTWSSASQEVVDSPREEETFERDILNWDNFKTVSQQQNKIRRHAAAAEAATAGKQKKGERRRSRQAVKFEENMVQNLRKRPIQMHQRKCTNYDFKRCSSIEEAYSFDPTKKKELKLQNNTNQHHGSQFGTCTVPILPKRPQFITCTLCEVVVAKTSYFYNCKRCQTEGRKLDLCVGCFNSGILLSGRELKKQIDREKSKDKQEQNTAEYWMSRAFLLEDELELIMHKPTGQSAVKQLAHGVYKDWDGNLSEGWCSHQIRRVLRFEANGVVDGWDTESNARLSGQYQEGVIGEVVWVEEHGSSQVQVTAKLTADSIIGTWAATDGRNGRIALRPTASLS